MAKVSLYGNYTQIPNAIITDSELSDTAKVLWMYIASKKDTWNFYDRNIMKETGLAKRNLQRKRKELVDAGYLVSQERVGESGAMIGMDYHMFNERSDRKEYANSIKGRNIGDDTPVTGGDDTPVTGTGVSVVSPLSNTNTNTNHIVTDKSDDDLPQAFTETMLEAIEVATHLSTKLSESMDNFKAPSIAGLHKWAKDIDLAIRKDARTKSELIELLNWVHDGSGTFWIANVRSGKKLRANLPAQNPLQTPTQSKFKQ